MIPKEAIPLLLLQEVPLADSFAFVSHLRRAPADELGDYPLLCSLDLFAPGHEIRLVFYSDLALQALCRALQTLMDDRDTDLDRLDGGLIVRLFTSRARDDGDPADGGLTP